MAVRALEPEDQPAEQPRTEDEDLMPPPSIALLDGVETSKFSVDSLISCSMCNSVFDMSQIMSQINDQRIFGSIKRGSELNPRRSNGKMPDQFLERGLSLIHI